MVFTAVKSAAKLADLDKGIFNCATVYFIGQPFCGAGLTDVFATDDA
jgi:hypothetical protein